MGASYRKPSHAPRVIHLASDGPISVVWYGYTILQHGMLCNTEGLNDVAAAAAVVADITKQLHFNELMIVLKYY